jgi:hypothetical protein
MLDGHGHSQDDAIVQFAVLAGQSWYIISICVFVAIAITRFVWLSALCLVRPPTRRAAASTPSTTPENAVNGHYGLPHALTAKYALHIPARGSLQRRHRARCWRCCELTADSPAAPHLCRPLASRHLSRPLACSILLAALVTSLAVSIILSPSALVPSSASSAARTLSPTQSAKRAPRCVPGQPGRRVRPICGKNPSRSAA